MPLLKSTLLVQPPSEIPPHLPWSPCPVLHVRFTTPFRYRSLITVSASLTTIFGAVVKANLPTLGPYFGVPKTPPAIYAPTEWDAYFCWEELSCVETGSYKLRVEVEVPGVGREVVESRVVLVWGMEGLGISERLMCPSADELKALKRLEEEVGKGPFRTVKYKKAGGPSWWLTI
ncbi:hypothetical protein B0T14DRAFT_570707 [Immersiella caudata]|uniref:Uncharacterized protein n=1 Tax=Immersiella caudata TaxID=314043 RepID=A0AA39U370_9PEZI|nr:hypothetical protein B0T14DRAFT_570707 [Immersiella caudata]